MNENSNEHSKVKNPADRGGGVGGNQLAIYKRGRGFELGTTGNKSSKWPERYSNSGPRDCESDHCRRADHTDTLRPSFAKAKLMLSNKQRIHRPLPLKSAFHPPDLANAVNDGHFKPAFA